MHIEPGVVDAVKMTLSYGTAITAVGFAGKLAIETVKKDGLLSLTVRSLFTTIAVFCYFQVLPHHPVGVSEVHLIMGSTLFLIFGVAPTAIGLGLGLALQGLLFAPLDLPQYGINLTTLLVPLYAMSVLAGKIIPTKTAYTDIKYTQALALSATYQAGIVSWVAFWAFYGQGFGAENLANVVLFGSAYMTVIIIEPLVDLAALAAAKSFRTLNGSALVERRLFAAA